MVRSTRHSYTGNPGYAQFCLGLVLCLGAVSAAGQPVRTSSPRPGQSRGPSRTLAADAALRALALRSGQVVCWVGTPPREPVTVPAAAKTMLDVVSGWADQWQAGTLSGPEVIAFHRPGAFAHVRPAHHDDQLVVLRPLPLLQRLPSEVLARFPLGLTQLPGRSDADAVREAMPLSLLEKERPGFTVELRRLLQEAGARVPSRGGDETGTELFFHELPTDRLLVRLSATAVAVCKNGERGAALEFPVSIAHYAVHDPLTAPAEPLRSVPVKPEIQSVHLFRGTLEELLRHPRLGGPLPKGVELVIDRRLRQLPLTVVVPPQQRGESLWPLLERVLGVERRIMGNVHFVGPWLDDERHQRFLFLSRWARTHRESCTLLLTPHAAHASTVPLSELDWRTRETVLAELMKARRRGDVDAAQLDPDEFRRSGRVMLNQLERVEVLYVSASTGTAPPTLLGRFRLSLR